MRKKPFQITPKFAMSVVGFMLLGMLAFFAGFLDFSRLGIHTRYDISHYLFYVFLGVAAFILLQIIVGLCWKRARKWGLLASSISILYALPVLMIIIETHSPKPIVVLSVGTGVAALIEAGIAFLIKRYGRLSHLLGQICLAGMIGTLVFVLGYEGLKEGGSRLLVVFRNMRSILFVVLGSFSLGLVALVGLRKSMQKWGLLAILIFLAIITAVSGQVATYVTRVNVITHGNTFSDVRIK